MNINRMVQAAAIALPVLLMTSCLGSDDVLEPSRLNMVTSCEFGADVVAYTTAMVRDADGQMVEVHDTTTYSASDFTFTIDQTARLIYLRDSLPYGSRVDKMPITIHSAGAYGTRLVDDGNGGEEEVLWSSTDSLDLREPVRIRVYASDEVTSRTYTIKVDVHSVDPDSLVWGRVADSFSAGAAVGDMRTVVAGDRLVTLAVTADGSRAAYINNWRDPAPAWTAAALTGDAADALVGSAQVLDGRVLMATASGRVVASADGQTWTVTGLDGDVQTLVGTITVGGVTQMVAIVDDGGTRRFRLTADGEAWTGAEGDVPTAFPADFFTGFETLLATSGTRHRLCVMGAEDPATALNDTTSFAWFTLDGTEWASMEGASTLRLPKLARPTMLSYAGQTLAFGTGDTEMLSRIFTSEDYGLVWRTSSRKVCMAYDFEGRTHYSAAVDGDGWIWMFFGNADGRGDAVWRGRVNRLGFAQ